MAKSSISEAPNSFVRQARKAYHPIGFSKGYNFILFVIFGGAFLGFSLARLQYLDVRGIFCKRNGSTTSSALPGECYYYLQNLYRVGILLHLAPILPGAILSLLQFLPIIRYKFLIFHRINGYVVILAALLSNAGVIIICRHAFGGDIATQSVSGFLVISTTLGLAMAYYNIKKLQIDQHRAWMLRVFVLMGAIITTRIILVICATVVSTQRNYYAAMPCGKVAYALNNSTKLSEKYPECISNPDAVVPVLAYFKKGSATTEQIAASFNLSFGAAFWLAVALHALGVEIYLKLTPRESARLRQVSYEKQLEAGSRHPGSAGIVIERFGDADPWRPIVISEKEATTIADDSPERRKTRY